jgi:tyrosyl-tRNA synthetase
MRHEDLQARQTFAQDIGHLRDRPIIDALVGELLRRQKQDLSYLEPQEQIDLIASKGQIAPVEELLNKMTRVVDRRVPLKVKLGIDATGRELHLGHAVPMVMASRFQRMGHKVDLVIGDFTAKIGDPSGRSSDRRVLSDEAIAENVRHYKAQLARFLELDKVAIVANTEWLNTWSMADAFELFASMPLAANLQREDFQKRLKSGAGITQAEILYANLMGIDSLHLGTDVELGGLDQTLNLHVCRKVMQVYEYEPEVIVTCPLIPGITGGSEKMSKSMGNFIGLLEEPGTLFGKLMSVPDSVLETYYKSLTEIHDSEWAILGERMTDSTLNPKTIKAALGVTIVGIMYGVKAAMDAFEEFELKFSRKDYTQLHEVTAIGAAANESIGSFLVRHSVVASRGEARRLIRQGAVQIISETDSSRRKVTSYDETFESAGSKRILLKVGKQRLFRVQFDGS